jgi:hypothetical protein
MDQRAVFRFLTIKKRSAKDIMAELEEMYENEPLSLSAMKKWRKGLINGRIIVESDSRSGRHVEAIFRAHCGRLFVKAPSFRANACVNNY